MPSTQDMEDTIKIWESMKVQKTDFALNDN